jgi:hypothetical protein
MSERISDLDLPTDIPDLPPPRVSDEEYQAWSATLIAELEQSGSLARQLASPTRRPPEVPFVMHEL